MKGPKTEPRDEENHIKSEKDKQFMNHRKKISIVMETEEDKRERA